MWIMARRSKVAGRTVDASTMDSLKGVFDGWVMAAWKVEILVVVGGFDVEIQFVNMYVNIKEDDMGRMMVQEN